MQGIYSGHKLLKGLHIFPQCVCACVCEFFISVNKLNELLTLQKRPPPPSLCNRKDTKEFGYTTGSTHHTEAWIIRPLVTPITEAENSRGLTLPFM